MIRATSMAQAFLSASIAPKVQDKNWVARTVIDRALHTNVGNVKERDVNLHLTRKTAVQLGIAK